MDRGAWQAIVHGVAKRQTSLNDWTHAHICNVNYHLGVFICQSQNLSQTTLNTKRKFIRLYEWTVLCSGAISSFRKCNIIRTPFKILSNYWVGQKFHSGFSVISHGKTQMIFWDNPISWICPTQCVSIICIQVTFTLSEMAITVLCYPFKLLYPAY